MADDILISMIIGVIIGFVFGYMGGRSNPSKTDLRIAYLQGRIDYGEHRDEPEDIRYRG